jgi:ribose transport system substrate-binding protein
MKKLRLLLTVFTIICFLLSAGVVFAKGKKAAPREDTVTETAEEEMVTKERTDADWWKAPSSGKMLADDLPSVDKNAGPFVIAFANNDMESGFTIDVWNGFKEDVKGYPNVDLHMYDCKNNPDDSLKVVFDIQTLNPDLVIYFNWVGAGQEMARWCEENKVPEIEVDVPYGENAWFYGVNNPMTGILGGEKLGAWVKKNWAGEDVWIVQNTEYESGEDVYLRNSEFLRVFLETAGDSVNVMNMGKDDKVDELNGDTSPELGLQLFSEWLTAHPDADHVVVWSMTDEAASGMYAAAKNQDRLEDCVFGSINGTSHAFNIIVEDKRYIGSIAIFPEYYGEELLKMAVGILTEKEIPKSVVTKYMWLSVDNLGEYYPQYFE